MDGGVVESMVISALAEEAAATAAGTAAAEAAAGAGATALGSGAASATGAGITAATEGLGSGVGSGLGSGLASATEPGIATLAPNLEGASALQYAPMEYVPPESLAEVPSYSPTTPGTESLAPKADFWNSVPPEEISNKSLSDFDTFKDYVKGAPSETGADSWGNKAWEEFKGLKPSKQLMYGSMGAMMLSPLLSKNKKYVNPYEGKKYFTSFTPSVPMAGGGIAALNESDYLSGGGVDETYAGGGITSLGGYSDGGRLLKGPGDGMSDNIPAQIGQKQPARLADGEFVVPADVVSHLGNGSTDAGAKQLYSMMDRVRQARTGNKQQGKQINPRKTLPV